MHRRPFNPVFWALANVGSRARYVPKVAAPFTSESLPPEQQLQVPTRHGNLRVVVVRPATPIARADATPPVIVQFHGGGFLNRYPEQDRHLARYFAAMLGAVVLMPDYSTAPKVRYPVAEEEAFDVVRWVQDSGYLHGWDSQRLFLSGISAGSKLSINVCQQLHAISGTQPLAVSLVVPVTDMSRTDRRSEIPRPAISPFIQRLVSWAYFPDENRRQEALAAPRFDNNLSAKMPPTLIQTGQHDTLCAEGKELAGVLQSSGVETRYIEYAGADHDFYASKPADRVGSVLTEITAFFAGHLPR